MNEKLSDYIDRDLIKTIRSQSKKLKRYVQQSLRFSKIRLIKLYDKETNIVYNCPATVYYRDETLITLYRFKLTNNEYVRNRSLYFSSNNIIKTLKTYKRVISKAHFKYYRIINDIE